VEQGASGSPKTIHKSPCRAWSIFASQGNFKGDP
jgi:hypothetical protein